MNTTKRPKVIVKNKYTLAFMMKVYREKAKKTQHQFSKSLNVSQTYYSDIELCRKRMIYKDVVKRIYSMQMMPAFSFLECFGYVPGVNYPGDITYSIPNKEKTAKMLKIIDDLETSDTVRRKDVDSIAWGVTVLEEYAKKAESRHVMLLEDISLLSQELRKIHYTLNNHTLWQRIKNIFRKNKSTEKISTNADVNSPKKSIDLSSNPNGMQ